jgi:hypothetical protein
MSSTVPDRPKGKVDAFFVVTLDPHFIHADTRCRRLVLKPGISYVGDDIAGTDGINVYLIRRQFQSQRLDESDDTEF